MLEKSTPSLVVAVVTNISYFTTFSNPRTLTAAPKHLISHTKFQRSEIWFAQAHYSPSWPILFWCNFAAADTLTRRSNTSPQIRLTCYALVVIESKCSTDPLVKSTKYNGLLYCLLTQYIEVNIKIRVWKKMCTNYTSTHNKVYFCVKTRVHLIQHTLSNVHRTICASAKATDPSQTN